jgi:hypothetical protein
MKLKKLFSLYPDIIFSQLIGFTAIFLSLFQGFDYIRWVTGFFYVFFLSGYSITRLLPNRASMVTRIITASLVSTVLTYPSSIITVLLEGQSADAIYGYHLTTSLTVLFLLSFLLTFFILGKRTVLPNFGKFPYLLFLPITIYTLLTLTNLNRADVFADEYDLGYQAYNLVDGIQAGRKALTVSFSGHPPLAMNIKHFSMNVLEPNGLDKLQDWQFRLSEAFMGLLTIIVTYALTKEVYSEKAAIISALFLSVNNYMIWMGRIFHREMYLTFFLISALFFFIKYTNLKKTSYLVLSGVSLGASLLVKETAIIGIVSILLAAIISRKYVNSSLKLSLTALLLFLPVFLYNIIAYLSAGYADVFFSNIFGLHRPGATPLETLPLKNAISSLSLLWDIYSPLVGLTFLISLLTYYLRRRNFEARLFAIYILTTLMFFSLTAVRSYYFLFLTPILVIILAKEMGWLPQRVRTPLIVIILMYSVYFSYNTNINRNYSRALDIGIIDGPVILKHPINTHFSLAARSWVEEVGYKNLQKALDDRIREGDCLIVKESINSLASRRYFSRRDGIKEYYLGSNYPSRYPRCSISSSDIPGIIFMISAKANEAGKLDKIISDHLGNQRFFLYTLPKGNLS